MEKDVLDLNTLIKNHNFFNKLFKSLCFILFSGLLIFWQINSLLNNINNFFLECILILIGIYFLFNGIWRFVYTIREYCLIKNGDIQIFIDTIIDKRKVFKSNEYDVNQHQVRLGNYSSLTNSFYCINSTEDFLSARVGSNCILVFTKLSKFPVNLYLCDKYVLGELPPLSFASLKWGLLIGVTTSKQTPQFLRFI